MRAVKTLFTLLCIGLIFYGILAFYVPVSTWGKAFEQDKGPSYNYNPTLICDNAFSQVVDFKDKKIQHFELNLPEGCFSPTIIVPDSWSSWGFQHGQNSPVGWVAFWYENLDQHFGPFGLDDSAKLANCWCGKRLRVQGKGRLILYKIR